MNNNVMAQVACDIIKEMPAPAWTQEELDFAQALNEQSPQYEAMKAAGLLEGSPIYTGEAEVTYRNGGGSTDVGDVQHIVPCMMLNTATCNRAAPGHSWQITACAGMSIGEKGMIYGAKVLAATAMKMVNDPKLVEEAKAEFTKNMNGRTYKCPIPKEIPIPQPQK